MRTVPEDLAARVETIRWTTAKRPQVIEELASSPDVADLIVPDGKEANERIRLAVERGDAETRRPWTRPSWTLSGPR